MSKEVEQRVVEMRFDNKNFEKNASETMSTLDKLKEKLNFRGIEKSFDGISSSARGINLSPISGAVDTVMAKFSAFDAITFSTLQNLTNRAISAGEKLVKSLSIDQISAGWKKYGDETKAVQTILNAKPELTIKDVEKELDRLSWFTDETSYSYSDMIDAIGQFTSYGVELDDAVTAMEGIANWAAASGQGINEARSAMRNLSQAMAKGVIQWTDWMSVAQTAHMSTEEFKTVAIETAKSMGLLDKQGKTVKGTIVDVLSFDSTLADKWFTGDVLMATLKKYGAYTDKVYNYIQDLDDASISCADAMERVSDAGMELSSKAFKAGQESKTLTDSLEATKDAVSSIWKDIFKSIFGNYEESKKLWTNVTSDLWDIFVADISDIRDVIKDWGMNDGGREDVFAIITNSLSALKSVIDVVREAFSTIFPPITTETLKNAASAIKKFTEKLILTDDKADKLQRTLQGLFAILDIIRIVVTDVVQIGLTIFNTLLGKSTDKIGDMTANMGDSIVSFRDWIKEHDHSVESIKKICDRIATVRKAIKDWIDDHIHLRESLSKLRRFIKDVFDFIKVSYIEGGGGIAGVVEVVFDSLANLARGLFGLLERITGKDLSNITNRVVTAIQKMRNNVVGDISELPSKIREFIDHLKTLDGLSFDNVKNAVKSFKDIVLGDLSGVGDGVDNLKTSFSTLKDSVTKNFNKAGDSIDGFRDKLSRFGKFVKEKTEIVTNFSVKWATTSNGLKTYATNAKKKLKELVDVGDLLSIALGGTLIMSIKNISDAMKSLNGLLKTFTSPFDALTGLFKSMKSVSDAYLKKISVDTMTKTIKAIALVMAVLIGVVVVLAKLSEQGTMWDGILGLLALAGVLVAIVGAFTLLGKVLNGLKIEVHIEKTVLAIAVAIGIIAIALKLLDGIDPDNVWRNVAVISVLATVMTALSIVISKCVKDVTASSAYMIAIAASIFILVSALLLLNKLKTDDIAEKLVVLLVAMGSLALIIYLSKNVGVGGALAILAVGGALASIVRVFSIVGAMKTKGIAKNIWVLLLAMKMLVSLLVASSLAGKHAKEGGLGILAMSVSILILVGAIKQIAKISVGNLIKGLAAISFLLTIYGVLVVLSHFSGENAMKAGVMLLLMSGALLIMTSVISIFAKMSASDLFKAVAAVSVLEILLGGLIAVSKFAGDAKNTLVGLSIAIAVMAVSLIALSFIEWDRLLPAAAALSLLMAAFAAMAYAAGQIKKAMATIIILAVVVAEFAVILYVLSELPWQSTLASAVAMGVLILALSGAMLILSKADSVSNMAILQMGTLAIIVGLLGYIMGYLNQNNFSASIASAVALGILINAMAMSLLILDRVESVNMQAIGALAGVALIVSMMAVIMGNLNACDFSMAIEQAISLSILLLAIVAATVILGNIGTGSLEAVVEGCAALIVVVASIAVAIDTFIAIVGVMILAIGAVMTGIGAAFNKWSSLESDLDKGIEIIKKVFGALGEFIGEFVGGIAEAFTRRLPMVAISLSTFMVGLQPFIIGAKKIDKSSLDGVKQLVGIIVLISAANVIDGIARFISGKNSMAKFTESLDQLAPAIKKYSDSITAHGGVNSTAIDESAKAVQSVVNLSKSIPRTGGLLQKLIGVQDLTTFTEDLEPLSAAIKSYSDAITAHGGINEKAVKDSGKAAQVLADLVNTLPSTGGKWQELVGIKDLQAFATDLTEFAPSIKKYSDTITAKGGINKKAVEDSGTAAKALAELNNTLPSRDGKLQEWIGTKDTLGSFGENIVIFGESLKTYSDTIKGGISIDAINISVTAAEGLSTLQNTLKRTGGVIDWYAGKKQDLSDFGSAISTFAEHIKIYAEKVSGIDPGSVVAAASAARLLAATAETVEKNKIDKKTFDGFGKALIELADKIISFYTSMQEISIKDLDSAIDKMSAVITMANRINRVSTTGLKDFADSLKNLAKKTISNFVNTFNNASKDVESVAETFLSDFISGLDAKKVDVDSEITTICSSAVAAFNAVYQDFEGAGKYLIEGFATGIRDNMPISTNAASDAAAAASKAAKNRLKEKSPSKEFYEIGRFAVLGMANALNDGGSTVYDSSYGMAGNAVSGLKKAIVGISDMIESDIDTQPTIRPVLDLSDIQNGTSRMNQMLGNRNLTLSAATADAISSDISVEMSTRTPNKENELLGKISDLLEGMDSKMSDEDETAPFVMNIENFNNNTDRDIDQLTDELSVRLATKINRKKAPFR